MPMQKIYERLMVELPKFLNAWKPFQVTLSERRPALEADKTLFNLGWG